MVQKLAQGQVVFRAGRGRGHANYGWLDTYHSFSFGDYYDPENMGYRSLRVINEDRVAGQEGFGTHPHRDMEILTYIVAGALQHKDSMGHTSVIKKGDVQKITAGTGITHSEFNASPKEEVHLLQIWIVPREKGLSPAYQEMSLPLPDSKAPLTLFGSPDGRDGTILFHQDVLVYRGILEPGQTVEYPLADQRGAWIQMISGNTLVSDTVLAAGDGASVEGEARLRIKARDRSEFLFFDLG